MSHLVGPREFALDVAAGLIPGYSSVHKFGANPSVGTTAETIWTEGGTYGWPTSAAQVTVSSDDANDAAAGTGARTVYVEGLSATFGSQNEIVTMNGTSGVTTQLTYLRVHRAYVETAGSTGTNEGNIFVGTGTITAGKPANVYSRVDATEGQTLQAFYTVPSGTKALLTDLTCTATSGKSVTCELLARPDGGAWRVQVEIILTEVPFMYRPYAPIGVYAAGTDLEVRATLSSTPAIAISGNFSMFLYPTA